MSTIGKRIAQKRELAGLNQSELARRLGLTPQSVQKWEAEESTPRGRRLEEIALALSTTTAYLVAGVDGLPPPRSNMEMLEPVSVWDDDTPLEGDEVYVPFLKEVELSAGNGRTSIQESSNRKLRFGRISLRNKGVDPGSARCVTVVGNSMEPILRNGSTVAVDTSNTRIVDGDMYAIDHAGQLRIKQLYRLPGAGLRIRSFNRDEHPDEEYTEAQVRDHEITILGRVFWSGGFH
ncbi:helix-turn-helix transcriptional regulator [Pseudomonas sp. MSSRFD41]|uniref:XRE family transcriptional regulator n=1 Tax=Pseudomonas sp. MSSRFD41 TaxID=1310370 RepID=UPI0016399F5B|nr:helix-turn-helix transcriptional regulator [Pseudomonas sp. MSSRFD41]MBC2655531.1 helix-turn-helix transcriptional regulator [Pseudomonas sp. MSSRFD41]